jgi:uncharacterized protein DUF2797
MPEAGAYLFTHVGFSRENSPVISLQNEHGAFRMAPFKVTLTLRFDMTARMCIGWHDMITGEDHSCPDKTIVDPKYDQCAACQQRTGFNPAFYNTSSVSPQQEERNLQPHILYLAHFGKGIVKVGISFAGRGNARLLEQGARSALILETFPTAHIARQYEAQIAALPGIVESLQLRKKITSLGLVYDSSQAATELIEVRQRIERVLSKAFSQSDVLSLDTHYFPDAQPKLHEAIETSEQHLLSGKVVGMVGCLLLCEQQDTPLFLPLKKYTGYTVAISYDETHIPLPARQISLF